MVLNVLAIDEEANWWDEDLHQVQFAINNTLNSSTGTSPSQPLFGYASRGGADAVLRDEVKLVIQELKDMVVLR